MKPSEEKLCENNLDAIILYLDALTVIRMHGGYGSVEVKVQNDLVMVEDISIKKQIPVAKKPEYRA
jgi:hypothetical protein